MCFSPMMSASFAVLGMIGTIVAWNTTKLRQHYTYVFFAFYTVMELLQTIQYFLVNKCDAWENKALNEFAYLLVIVQPLMWNIIFYNRVSKANKGIFIMSILLCILWIFMHLASRYPALISKYGLSTDVYADSVSCTRRRSETSHLYWKWPIADFHGLDANWFMYLSLWFVPCLLVEETRPTGLILVIGAIIGALITYKYGKTQEFASTWCFISIPLLMITMVDAFVINST